jgi:tellurite resistance protein TerC
LFAELGARGYRLARRIVIGVIGGTVVLAGIVMLVTPGPALLVIPLGLTILAAEFAWARHWLKRLKDSLSKEQLNGLLDKTRKLGVKDPPPPPRS